MPNGNKHKIQSALINGERGSTLVEVMIALALIVSVTIPVGLFLGYMAHYPDNREKILALGEAQTALEEMLRKPAGQENTVEVLRPGWFLEKEQVVHDGWIWLHVTVYRNEKLLVSLSTARLFEDE